MAFKNSPFYVVDYEEDNIKYTCNQFADWIVKMDSESNIYFSNDDIYHVMVKTPENIIFKDIIYMYEYNGEVIIIYNKNNTGYGKLSIPTTELYSKLNAQKDAPYVMLDNEILGFEYPPVIESDRTLVPMRFLFEQMGADVEWNQDKKEATATMGDTVIRFGIDNTTATVNGEEVTMDVPARLINDKTMVPLRFLSENMGYTVDWDSETRTAVIEK